MGIHSPPQPTPAPLPTAHTPPYLASSTAARAGRPIDPWRSSLRFMLLLWGGLTILFFVAPQSIDPLRFGWDEIIDNEGKAKIPALLVASIGLLAVVVGAVPMITVPRGIIAVVLGLGGVFTPFVLFGDPADWQAWITIAGLLTLVPGLLLRNEYTESLLPRVLVTIGVICALVPLLVPQGGSIPLVGLFKAILDAPGEAKVAPLLQLVYIVVVVMSLLAWMPGPATGGAKVFAWVILLFPVVLFVIGLLVAGGIGDMITGAPGALLAWIPGVTFAVLVGYGMATVLGKQLE
jgi:hypothetical protein